ncbi:MAG: hypothetical protein AAF596_03735 [Planctomycetota bacterium]
MFDAPRAELELQREYLRHEQTDSEYCLLELQTADGEPFGDDGATVCCSLVDRLRCCDLVGWINPCRLVVLLVDTNLAGGETVADDLDRLLAATNRAVQIELSHSGVLTPYAGQAHSASVSQASVLSTR